MCDYMDTASAPTVRLRPHLVVMEKPVTLALNNYISRHNTRRSRTKGRRVWIGLGFAVVSLLSLYGATKAIASSAYTEYKFLGFVSAAECVEALEKGVLINMAEHGEGSWEAHALFKSKLYTLYYHLHVSNLKKYPDPSALTARCKVFDPLQIKKKYPN